MFLTAAFTALGAAHIDSHADSSQSLPASMGLPMIGVERKLAARVRTREGSRDVWQKQSKNANR
jgi:hypothetical protein